MLYGRNFRGSALSLAGTLYESLLLSWVCTGIFMLKFSWLVNRMHQKSTTWCVGMSAPSVLKGLVYILPRTTHTFMWLIVILLWAFWCCHICRINRLQKKNISTPVASSFIALTLLVGCQGGGGGHLACNNALSVHQPTMTKRQRRLHKSELNENVWPTPWKSVNQVCQSIPLTLFALADCC